MQKEEIIVIATSIPENRLAYRRDLLNCLCYPSGIPVRFSYRKRWIEDKLLEPNQFLKNCSALIIFCDLPEKNTQHFRFIPLRFAQFEGFEPTDILKYAEDDTYITVKFLLNRFVYLSPKGVDDLLESWQSWVFNQGDKFPRPIVNKEERKSNFVFKASNFKEGQEITEETSWQILMEQLSRTRTLKDCSFFRAKGIFKMAKDLNKPISIQEVKSYKAYVLQSGESYIFELEFYLDPGIAKPPKSLIPRVSTQSIALSQPLIKNIGLATNASIILSCNRVYATEIATVVIQDPDDKNVLTPRAEFLLILKPKRWILFLILSMLAIGAFFTGVSAEMIRDIAAKGSFFENYATLISYLIKGVGAFLIGAGGYFGFKKIPTL